MNTGEKKQLTLSCAVDNYRSGWTVVEFLAHRFKYHPADAWASRVRDARVRVNGASVAVDHVVYRDDAIDYTIEHAEPDVDERYQVLFEDDHLLAVSKSGNIPVHACGVFITHTLIATLKRHFGDGLNLCHRLDRETSGVVVLSKHKEANRRLAHAFSRGDVEKRYRAVVYGAVEQDFQVDAPIGKIDIRHQYPDEYEYGKANDLATYLPKRVVDYENGKPAATGFEVVGVGGAVGGGALGSESPPVHGASPAAAPPPDRPPRYTELRVIPLQGRTNQIRVHLHHAGFPLVGDKIYGLSGEVRDELLREGLTARVRQALVLDRHALHCERLAFDHPMTGERVVIEVGVPADMVGLVG